MKAAIALLVLLGAAFAVALAFAPLGRSTPQEKQDFEASLSQSGPPDGIELLAWLLTPFSPSVQPETTGTACPGPNGAEVPAAEGEARRLLKPSLRTGDGLRLVYEPRDPREDGGSGPYILCLAAKDWSAPLPDDCQSRARRPGGSLPIGPKGGCLSWESIGAAPAEPIYE